MEGTDRTGQVGQDGRHFGGAAGQAGAKAGRHDMAAGRHGHCAAFLPVPTTGHYLWLVDNSTSLDDIYQFPTCVVVTGTD